MVICLFILMISLCFQTLSLNYIDTETLHSLTNVNKETIVQTMKLLEKIEKEAEASWSAYYHIFPNIINKFNLKKGCEIGVSTGGHSYKILETTNVEKLYSIDPYIPNSTLNLWVNGDYYYDILYYRVKYRLGKFGTRSELIRAFSTEVINLFKDNDLDFVFVDGSHEYKDVKNDLILYYEKIRPGGFMAGDDYNTGFSGVPQAVNEFFNSKNIKINIDQEQSRIWWVQKP